jgi:hypothetical protein
MADAQKQMNSYIDPVGLLDATRLARLCFPIGGNGPI